MALQRFNGRLFGNRAVLSRLKNRIKSAQPAPTSRSGVITAYSPDQPRDARGRFGSGGESKSIDVNKIPTSEWPLTPKGQQAEDNFRNTIAKDPEKMFATYQARYGNELNADNAKELSKDYQKDRGLALAVHEPAAWIVKQLFDRKVAEPTDPGKSNAIMFMAGGAGTGKTTALNASPEMQAVKSQAHAVLDGTFQNPAKSIAKIQQALTNGKEAVVVYVHRDPVQSFGMSGMLGRAQYMEDEHGTGRTVLLNEFTSQHSKMGDSINTIANHFQGNPKFSLAVIDNSGGPGQAKSTTLDQLPKSPSYHELVPKLRAHLEGLHSSGQISSKIYHSVLGH